MKIAVLGGGVIGITTAWYLRSKGLSVTVFERQPGAALETSFANGGQISVSHAEPWASPTTLLKALRWLTREDAPLLFRLRAERALLSWSARFLRECLPWRTRTNIGRIVELARYSRSELQRLRALFADEDPLDYQQLERGILHIYTDRREYAHAMHAATMLRAFGCDRRPVDVDACIHIEPALAPVRHQLVGGDFTAEDESGDAHLFTRRLAERCAAAGVGFRFGTTVTGLETEGGRIAALTTLQGERIEADGFVIAAGSHSPALLAPLGIHIPVYPAKGYSATIPLSPESIAPHTSLTDDAHKLVFSRLGDRLRVAGTAEFDGFNLRPSPARQAALMRRVNALFPALRPAGPVAHWCGLRPVTPGSVPMIGPTRHDNLWLNTGHGTLGWTMACGSAAALSDLIAGIRPAVPLTPIH
ncbi:D-amino acid dehydrogenase [Thauera humireducens]|uniref:Amino acid dehydrogenase n=1 Tax=Thauera humireducens TaxID=1134435 RepID=A0A127K8S5_9RHOO|nr:D-amino acid dehydrogenase [Thauera humireducens]AMO38322.1 amino acid dehydrogenase [Thauera humireducens]